MFNVNVSPEGKLYGSISAREIADKLTEMGYAVEKVEVDQPEGPIRETGEYTVGLIGNPGTGFTVLPPLVVDYSALSADLPPILTYGSKADPESGYWQKLTFRQADIDDVTWSALVDDCGGLAPGRRGRRHVRPLSGIEGRRGKCGSGRRGDKQGQHHEEDRPVHRIETHTAIKKSL